MQTVSHTGRASIALVGSNGRMGSMLQKAWQENGFTVEGISARAGGDFEGGTLGQAEVVVVAVPVFALEEVLERIGPYLGPEQLLMDITSVKTRPVQLMEKYHRGPVIGAHPLFGPMPAREDLRTVLVAGRGATAQWKSLAESLFSCLGSAVSWSTAQEHDHGVAFAQSLNFAMSTAFFSTIARHKECLPFLTPSFKRHMEAARKHLTQDREMFCEFTAHNPCFPEAVRAYQQALEETLTDLPSLSAEAAVWYKDK